jgi:chromate transporter
MAKILFETFLVFLKLGCISFGGPLAHMGYFHSEFVSNRKWLTEEDFADLIAVCNFLPGPASSQMGMAIGCLRGGILGSILAFVGFTLPSAILMTSLGLGLLHFRALMNETILHALQIGAVVVIAQALWQMTNKLTPDRNRFTLAIVAAIFVSFQKGISFEIIALVAGGACGYFLFGNEARPTPNRATYKISKRASLFFLFLFFLLLITLPLVRIYTYLDALALFDHFYRAGSLVFGGGHVVLSLLEEEIVAKGILSSPDFTAGYGLVQAMPGPLFSISAFIGAMNSLSINGIRGALICLTALFLPGFLLILGVLPFWSDLQKLPKLFSIMKGVNAIVVGMLIAVFYNPLFLKTILNVFDFYQALVAFLLLQFWKVPIPFVLLILIISGLILNHDFTY